MEQVIEHIHNGIDSQKISTNNIIVNSFLTTPKKSPTSDYQVANKYYSDLITSVSASDNLAISADTERTFTNSSAALKKSIRINTFGTIRVKFSTISTVDGFITQGRIYINGVEAGTLRPNSDLNVWHEYSEDFTVSQGDFVQLYNWVGSGGTGKCKNFRIYYDMAKLPLSTSITD
jgi:hypothetical protein